MTRVQYRELVRSGEDFEWECRACTAEPMEEDAVGDPAADADADLAEPIADPAEPEVIYLFYHNVPYGLI